MKDWYDFSQIWRTGTIFSHIWRIGIKVLHMWKIEQKIYCMNISLIVLKVVKRTWFCDSYIPINWPQCALPVVNVDIRNDNLKLNSVCSALPARTSMVINCSSVYILKDFENASPRLNPLFHKPWECQRDNCYCES